MADGWFGRCAAALPWPAIVWGALTVRDSRRSAEHEDLDLCAAISGRSDLQDLHVGTRLANASVGGPYSAGRLAQPHKAVARLPVTLRIGKGPNLMTASGQILGSGTKIVNW